MRFKEYRQLPKNLFGILYWNIFSCFVPIFIVLGLLSLFGIKPIEFDSKPTYGIVGLLTALIMGPFMSLVTAFAVWILLTVGNLVLRLFIKKKLDDNGTIKNS
jgi:hypothetical protein